VEVLVDVAGDPEVRSTLVRLVQNKDEYDSTRRIAAKALGASPAYLKSLGLSDFDIRSISSRQAGG
jgi:hypothetical protein